MTETIGEKDEYSAGYSEGNDEGYEAGWEDGIAYGTEKERARCISIASRDVEVVDQVSGTRFMRKPDCSCAKDISAGTK